MYYVASSWYRLNKLCPFLSVSHDVLPKKKKMELKGLSMIMKYLLTCFIKSLYLAIEVTW